MTDNADRGDLPQATVVPKKHRRVSVVWIIPILAAAIAIGIAVQRILSEGPTITIVFKAAQGIEAGKTFIKYKDVNIGQVSAVQLTDDFSKVKVTAKIAKNAAGLMVEDAQFWVVEPRITLSGVSGLGTLLSGNYIGFEAGQSARKQVAFTGLNEPPPLTQGDSGRMFTLQASKLGSLGIGAPVYYRSLEAGQVIGYRLAPGGKSVNIDIFVKAPYDKYVNTETRFWNASGLDVSIGANGVNVRTESLVSLIAGGMAFDDPPFASDGEPASANAVFTLFADETSAMKQPEAIAQHYVLYFNESLRGLSVGAPVTLLGLQGGEVTEVGLDFDPKTKKVRGRVEIVTYPERLVGRMHGKAVVAGQAVEHSAQKRHAFIQQMFEHFGMRGQLQSGSLLTGQLFVAFDFFPNAKKMKIDWNQEVPELPVVPGTLPNLEEKVGSILTKLDNLQWEKIGSDTRQAIETFNQVLKDADKALVRFDSDLTPEIKSAIEEFRRATASADRMIRNADATLVSPDAPGQQALRNAMQEVARAARSLRVLTDYLERHPEALIRGKTEEKP
ncbi:MAG: MCE family protein [Thiobacillus sp.]|nr:MCE family protein [Thiobacillus sp.]